MSNKGQIEILLLLCCVVGVVAFLSFAMGILTLGTKIEESDLLNPSLLVKQLDELRINKNLEDEEISLLEKEIRELRMEIEEWALSPTGRILSQKERLSKLEEALERAKEELEKLMKRKREKEEELQRSKQISHIVESGEKESELKILLEKLERELEEIAAQIRIKESEFARLPSYVDDTLDKEISKLKKGIEDATRRKKNLEEELARRGGAEDIFNPWQYFTGALSLSNPLFVECKKDILVFHPQKRVVSVSDMNKENPFPIESKKHDGIVFLIRPSGFKSFRESFSLAEKTKLPLAYEPVDSDKRLEFVR